MLHRSDLIQKRLLLDPFIESPDVEWTLNEARVFALDSGRDLLWIDVLLSRQLVVGRDSIEDLRQSSICFDSSYLHFPKVGF